ALWKVSLDVLSDAEVATALGADIPVCLKEKPAVMSGIGENVRVVTLPEAWVVLANPNKPLATRAVFGKLAGRFSAPMEPFTGFADVHALTQFLERQRNDLTTPAVELMPAIGDILKALAATSGCLLARLSGSGPTCFGLFATPDDARVAAARLESI